MPLALRISVIDSTILINFIFYINFNYDFKLIDTKVLKEVGDNLIISKFKNVRESKERRRNEG